ncbi:MAG: hypothetical protein HeimC3_42500 [Candidatus Heimdallarchaeota archaeon LC_3]|nr:MAG: hypothetical protein HeimC3_42500 [Candidatus Heimdallarchaeota archaeon LC_3]
MNDYLQYKFQLKKFNLMKEWLNDCLILIEVFFSQL